MGNEINVSNFMAEVFQIRRKNMGILGLAGDIFRERKNVKFIISL